MIDPSGFEILLKILVAILLGGVIGAERYFADKPAGLRTHMIVAAAAALLVSSGDLVVGSFHYPQYMTADPIRIIEAVIVGISFLGAGTIFKKRGENDVEGLTTGATILLTAGIGILVAVSQYLLAAAVTVLIVLIMYGLGYVEKRFLDRTID